MNKQELINVIAGKTELTKKDATEVLELIFETVSETLANGEEVSIAGHGKYEVRTRSARKGVNPTLLKELKSQGIPDEQAKEQATIDIPESKVPAFKPAKGLKDRISGK